MATRSREGARSSAGLRPGKGLPGDIQSRGGLAEVVGRGVTPSTRVRERRWPTVGFLLFPSLRRRWVRGCRRRAGVRAWDLLAPGFAVRRYTDLP